MVWLSGSSLVEVVVEVVLFLLRLNPNRCVVDILDYYFRCVLYLKLLFRLLLLKLGFSSSAFFFKSQFAN